MINFLISSGVCVIILYLPGALGLLAAGASVYFGLIFAPFVSIAIFEINTILFSYLGITCEAYFLILISVFLSLFIGLCLRMVPAKTAQFNGSPAICILGAVVSFIFAWLVYFRPLGYASIIPGYDTVFHINLIQAFIDSKSYSPFDVSLYNGSNYSPINADNGFYPAAWHFICTSVREITGFDSAYTVNSVNCVLCSVCFAEGQVVLVSRITKVNKYHLASLSILALLSTTYPWTQLVQGEQFPQIASFALLPLSCALFDILLECRLKDLVVLLCGLSSLLTLATLQTNAVFALCIFVLFDVIHYAAIWIKSGNKSLGYLLITIVGVTLWTTAYYSPAMAKVVSVNWNSTDTIFGLIINILIFNIGNTGPQLGISILILIGIYQFLSQKFDHVCLIAPFIFFCVVYISTGSSIEVIKHYISGFWYTDQTRIGSLVSIFAFPIIATGVIYLENEVVAFISSINENFSVLTGCIVILTFLLVLLIGIPAVNQNQSSFLLIWNSIDAYRTEKYEPILSKSEIDFAEAMGTIVDKESLILNVPDDGSSILYGEFGFNVYYKRQFAFENETEQSKVLREGLSSIATDVAVRETAKSIGAKYLLLLDTDDSSGLFDTYKEDHRWATFYSINENTPGFKLLLNQGDCYLYEICF